MSQLLIDIGSSAFKWSILQQGKLGAVESVLHAEIQLTDYLDVAWRELPVPQSIVVSLVGQDSLFATLATWCDQHWQQSVECITSQATLLGVSNAYTEPSQLGSDRWLGLLLAHHQYPGNSCIVNCGTALTIDVINADGAHLGGMILPGRYMMQTCLYDRSAGIARALQHDIDAETTHNLLATDTHSALAIGSLYAAVSLIDRFCVDIEAELQTPVQCLITGGDARDTQELLQCQTIYVDNMVLQGLALLCEQYEAGQDL